MTAERRSKASEKEKAGEKIPVYFGGKESSKVSI